MFKFIYPFQAVFFVLSVIAVTILFCLDAFISAVVIAVCFVIRAHKVVIFTSRHIEDTFEAANEAVIGISELSEEVLSKKQNDENSDI